MCIMLLFDIVQYLCKMANLFSAYGRFVIRWTDSDSFYMFLQNSVIQMQLNINNISFYKKNKLICSILGIPLCFCCFTRVNLFDNARICKTHLLEHVKNDTKHIKIGNILIPTDIFCKNWTNITHFIPSVNM